MAITQEDVQAIQTGADFTMNFSNPAFPKQELAMRVSHFGDPDKAPYSLSVTEVLFHEGKNVQSGSKTYESPFAKEHLMDGVAQRIGTHVLNGWEVFKCIWDYKVERETY